MKDGALAISLFADANGAGGDGSDGANLGFTEEEDHFMEDEAD